MKILVAPDKFKQSLTAFEVCRAVKEGFTATGKDIQVVELPLSDGGDGFLDILQQNTDMGVVKVSVSDPLFRKIPGWYLASPDRRLAFIETAKASGLVLLQPEERHCLDTSTFGTGETIKIAAESGATRIVIGLGGSATNDGGIGMAAALGYRFLDAAGKDLLPIGRNLNRITRIDGDRALQLHNIQVELACDVNNPLLGKDGTAFNYARQKGASDHEIVLLEQGMQHYADILEAFCGRSIRNIPGSGAAGGLGAGCIAFLHANVRSGIEIVLEQSKAEQLIREADLVISGEGKLDEQSLKGKVVSGVAQLCRKHRKPLIVFCGRQELNKEQLQAAGISRAIGITPQGMEERLAFSKAADHLRLASQLLLTEVLQN